MTDRQHFPAIHGPLPGEVAERWWCPVCGAAAHRIHRPGRPRVYCSNACRQRAYRWRRRHGVRLFVSEEHPAERAMTADKRHALRDRRDFVAQRRDERRREIAVCGSFARPTRLGRFTHHRFLPDHPWSCRTCVSLVGYEPPTNRPEPAPPP